MNYYEHHLGDYYRKAKHLTMLEHGAYRMLLDLYYIHEEPLPADMKAIQRLAGARMDDEKEAVENVVREFFTLSDDGWRHAKCDEEIEKARVRIEAARKNGKSGGRPKKNPDETEKEPKSNPPETQRVKSGFDLETQTKALHYPDTIHQTDDDKAGDPVTAMSGLLWEAGGKALNTTSTGLIVMSRPIAWLQDGCDMEADILPAIRAASARASPQSIRSWKYFDQAVADARARRLAPMPEGRNDERPHAAKSADARARENHLIGIQQALAERRG